MEIWPSSENVEKSVHYTDQQQIYHIYELLTSFYTENIAFLRRYTQEELWLYLTVNGWYLNVRFRSCMPVKTIFLNNANALNNFIAFAWSCDNNVTTIVTLKCIGFCHPCTTFSLHILSLSIRGQRRSISPTLQYKEFLCSNVAPFKPIVIMNGNGLNNTTLLTIKHLFCGVFDLIF